jgi:hypothetical protein
VKGASSFILHPSHFRVEVNGNKSAALSKFWNAIEAEGREIRGVNRVSVVVQERK